jgi:hypothetical protein
MDELLSWLVHTKDVLMVIPQTKGNMDSDRAHFQRLLTRYLDRREGI